MKPGATSKNATRYSVRSQLSLQKRRWAAFVEQHVVHGVRDSKMVKKWQEQQATGQDAA